MLYEFTYMNFPGQATPQRQESVSVVGQDWGGMRMSEVCCGDEENVVESDGGDCCTTL